MDGKGQYAKVKNSDFMTGESAAANLSQLNQNKQKKADGFRQAAD